MKFDLGDWENRKAALFPVLDAAAQEGLIQREQTGKLADFLLGRGVGVGVVATPSAAATEGMGLDTPVALEPASSVEESEAPRFVRGFHDILITIGIIVGLLGLGGLLTPYSVIPAAIILGEILVRRQRLALPAVVLTLAITFASLFGVVSIFDGDNGGSFEWLPVAVMGTIALVTLLFYWRYQVPLALAACLVAAYGAVIYSAGLWTSALSGDASLFNKQPILFALFLGLFALLVFGTALKFDFADRNRLTRRSDVAFWMHLAAAPAILYTIMAHVYLGRGKLGWFAADTTFGQATTVVVAVFVLMLIGIVLDRRAFVTSGLLSFGYAFKVLLTEGGFATVFRSSDTMAFTTLLTIGVIVLALGIGWQPLRRAIVRQLPGMLQNVLPPVKA